jgi:hypothetical protein
MMKSIFNNTVRSNIAYALFAAFSLAMCCLGVETLIVTEMKDDGDKARSTSYVKWYAFVGLHAGIPFWSVSREKRISHVATAETGLLVIDYFQAALGVDGIVLESDFVLERATIDQFLADEHSVPISNPIEFAEKMLLSLGVGKKHALMLVPKLSLSKYVETGTVVKFVPTPTILTIVKRRFAPREALVILSNSIAAGLAEADPSPVDTVEGTSSTVSKNSSDLAIASFWTSRILTPLGVEPKRVRANGNLGWIEFSLDEGVDFYSLAEVLSGKLLRGH